MQKKTEPHEKLNKLWIEKVEQNYSDFKQKRQPIKQKNPHKEVPFEFFNGEETKKIPRPKHDEEEEEKNQRPKRIKIEDSQPTTLSVKMAKFLTMLFENARPIDIAEVREAYGGALPHPGLFASRRASEMPLSVAVPPEQTTLLQPPSITINDTDSVPKQLKNLAKHLIGVSIPDFIHVINQVITATQKTD
jgi:hypothetical protein